MQNSSISYLSKTKTYLWDKNPAFVQILGLCPLLAVSTSFVNSFVMAVTTIFVMSISMILISSFKKFISDEIRLPIFVLLIAGMTLIVEFILQAWTYAIYVDIGIFIPLIITNCIILASAESYAYKNNILASFGDAIGTASGFGLSIIVIGTIREVIGNGSIFANMNDVFSWWSFSYFIPIDSPFILVTLPPGAFLILGLIIATKNYLSNN